MKINIIVNPASGSFLIHQMCKHIVKILEKHFSTQAIYTQYPRHAIEIAKECIKEGCDVIVAVGGDGTVNEVASSLKNSNTSLFIIPTGSGNGLARDLNMHGLTAWQIIKRIENNKWFAIDSGLANNIPFFCTCGIGYDALIGHLFARSKTRGFFTYAKLFIQSYRLYKSSAYEVSYNQDTKKIKAFMINVANSKQWGNNAFIAPKASLNDGEFTVTIIKPFKWYIMPYMLCSLFFKQIHNNKYVQTFNCNSIEITSLHSRNTRFHIDGEPITLSNNTITLTTEPSTLRVL